MPQHAIATIRSYSLLFTATIPANPWRASPVRLSETRRCVPSPCDESGQSQPMRHTYSGRADSMRQSTPEPCAPLRRSESSQIQPMRRNRPVPADATVLARSFPAVPMRQNEPRPAIAMATIQASHFPLDMPNRTRSPRQTDPHPSHATNPASPYLRDYPCLDNSLLYDKPIRAKLFLFNPLRLAGTSQSHATCHAKTCTAVPMRRTDPSPTPVFF